MAVNVHPKDVFQGGSAEWNAKFFKIDKHQDNCLQYHGNTYCIHCSIIKVSILNRY